jgi:hypothetical protein
MTYTYVSQSPLRLRQSILDDPLTFPFLSSTVDLTKQLRQLHRHTLPLLLLHLPNDRLSVFSPSSLFSHTLTFLLPRRRRNLLRHQRRLRCFERAFWVWVVRGIDAGSEWGVGEEGEGGLWGVSARCCWGDKGGGET